MSSCGLRYSGVSWENSPGASRSARCDQPGCSTMPLMSASSAAGRSRSSASARSMRVSARTVEDSGGMVLRNSSTMVTGVTPGLTTMVRPSTV